MDDEQFEILLGKLDEALRLLALNLVKEAEGDQRVKILASANFGAAEIAEMLEMKRNAVNQALHRLRQKGKESYEELPTEQGTKHREKG
jgi:DNA-directed RNA polymerase specialized sigma24 family protein